MKQVLESGGWLTDEHIQLAQELLKKEYPRITGLQPSVLSQNDGFIPVQRNSESIQLHNVDGNHWAASTSIGGQVTVLDSMWMSRDGLSS